MNIREAILKAADSIEQNPGLFDFRKTTCPDKGCGSPGCALGWIGFHLGRETHDGGYFDGGLTSVLNMDPPEFYDRMNLLAKTWKESAGVCAAALRIYADKYYPQAIIKYQGIPVWCREIFEEVAA